MIKKYNKIAIYLIFLNFSCKIEFNKINRWADNFFKISLGIFLINNIKSDYDKRLFKENYLNEKKNNNNKLLKNIENNNEFLKNIENNNEFLKNIENINNKLLKNIENNNEFLKNIENINNKLLENIVLSNNNNKLLLENIILSNNNNNELMQKIMELNIKKNNDEEDEDLESGNNKKYLVENVKENLDDVVAYEEQKETVRNLINHFNNKEDYEKYNIFLPKGILFYGPPGCGKTNLARVIATQTNKPFLYASASGFDQEYVGVGAKRIRELFEEAKKVANEKQSDVIIFVDEIDTIGGKRNEKGQQNQTINQLLISLDGFEKEQNYKIIFMAATNMKDSLDEALLRGGRLETKIEFKMPNKEDLKKIFLFFIKKKLSFLKDQENETIQNNFSSDLKDQENETIQNNFSSDLNKKIEELNLKLNGTREDIFSPADIKHLIEESHRGNTEILDHLHGDTKKTLDKKKVINKFFENLLIKIKNFEEQKKEKILNFN